MLNNKQLVVDQTLIEQATQCNLSHACLSESEYIPCEIDYTIDDKAHFVKCLVRDDCRYKQSFGFSIICTCPVRLEIFKKFGR